MLCRYTHWQFHKEEKSTIEMSNVNIVLNMFKQLYTSRPITATCHRTTNNISKTSLISQFMLICLAHQRQLCI